MTGLDIGVYVPQMGFSYQDVLRRARGAKNWESDPYGCMTTCTGLACPISRRSKRGRSPRRY